MENSYNELIHLYLDGSLPETLEELLFAELARNAELRAEMTEQMNLMVAIKKHAGAIKPDPSVKAAIFTHLGLPLASAEQGASGLGAIGNAVPTITATATPGIMPTSRWFAFSGAVMLSLISSALTAFIMMAVGAFHPSVSQQAQLPEHTPFVSRTDTVVQQRTVIKYLVRTAARQLDNEPSISPDSKNETSATLPEHRPLLSDKASDIYHNFSSTQPKINGTPTFIAPQKPFSHDISSVTEQIHRALTEDNGNGALGLTVGVRGLRQRSVVEPTLEPAIYPLFNNTALNVMLQLSEHHALGVEIGQEAYFLRYKSLLPEYGITPATVERNPVLSWIGVAYRYTMLPASSFSPFVHAVLGATGISAVGRSMIGLQYAMDTRTTCFVGFEAGSLLYRHENQWYASPNIGLSYGISVRF